MKKSRASARARMYRRERWRYITGHATPGWKPAQAAACATPCCAATPRPILFEQGDLVSRSSGIRVDPKENVRHSFAWIKGAAGPASTQQVNKFADAGHQGDEGPRRRPGRARVDFVDINMIQVFRKRTSPGVDG